MPQWCNAKFGASNPKSWCASARPFLSKPRRACLSRASVAVLCPFQEAATANNQSGCDLEMSFKWLATERRTYSEGSFLSFSSTGRVTVGSFFSQTTSCPQGKRGLKPSLASRRTCSLEWSAQVRCCCSMRSGYSCKNGRTANSALKLLVSSANAGIDKSGSAVPCTSTKSGNNMPAKLRNWGARATTTGSCRA